MYYYLHSLYYSFSFSDLLNFDINLDKSIQQVNFYIYLFGLFGYYVLLRFHKFSRSVIFGVLTFINFFPPAISMRLVFKPEILAFALFPWIIYLIEKFQLSLNSHLKAEDQPRKLGYHYWSSLLECKYLYLLNFYKKLQK